MQMLRKAHDNPFVKQLYDRFLRKTLGDASHGLLHTEYGTRRRIEGEDIKFSLEEVDGRVDVGVCVGTCCYLHGSYDLLRGLMDRVNEAGLDDKVNLHATFCFENCEHSPNIQVGGEIVSAVREEDIDRIFKEKILSRLQDQ